MNGVRFCRRASAATYLALMAVLLGWLLWQAPAQWTSVLTALALLPLALPLRRVLAGHRYTLAWTSMLVLAYFCHGVAVAAGEPPESWLGLAEAALALAYFGFAVAYVRLSREPRQADPAHP